MYIKATSDTIHHPGTVNKHTHTHAQTNHYVTQSCSILFVVTDIYVQWK